MVGHADHVQRDAAAVFNIYHVIYIDFFAIIIIIQNRHPVADNMTLQLQMTLGHLLSKGPQTCLVVSI